MKVMGKHMVEVRNIQNVRDDKACVLMRTVEMWKDGKSDQIAMHYIKLDSGWLQITWDSWVSGDENSFLNRLLNK